jgi:hypothetical protein
MKFFKGALLTALIALISIPIGLWMLSRVAFFVIFFIALPWLLVTPLRLFFGGKAFPDEWVTKNSMVCIFSYLSAFFSLTGIGVIAYLAIFLGADKNDVYPFAFFAASIVGIFTLVVMTRKMVEDELLDKRDLNFKVLPND